MRIEAEEFNATAPVGPGRPRELDFHAREVRAESWFLLAPWPNWRRGVKRPPTFTQCLHPRASDAKVSRVSSATVGANAGIRRATRACMCLGVPGRVISIDGDVAQVDFWGVTKPVRLDVVDAPVQPGDYVLNHVGFAIRRIPAEEIGETLALYDELLKRAGESDLMALDVRGELAATGERDD